MLKSLHIHSTVLCLSFYSLFISCKLALSNTWGYDEFGPIVSFLELDEREIIDTYYEYIPETLKSYFLDKVTLEYLLAIFIIPIRWTYALGISPWLNISRVITLDWEIQRLILLIPYILLSAIGFYLIIKSIKNDIVKFLFLTFILFSLPFTYWIPTVSSYSHHLFCFGLIIYGNNHVNISPGILSRKSIANTLAILFNYQYIPIIFLIGLSSLIKNKLFFFKNSYYKFWILPAFFSLSSFLFLIIRGKFTGKHLNPTYAALPQELSSSYNFIENIGDPLHTIYYLFKSYLAIINSFFYPFNFISYLLVLIFLIGILIFKKNIYKSLNPISQNILNLSYLSLISTFVLHITGVMPLSPSRHQLIMFLPFSLIIAFYVDYICKLLFNCKLILSVFLIFLFLSITVNLFFSFKNSDTYFKFSNLKNFQRIANNHSVQRILLTPCNFQLILEPYIRNNFSTVYRCGPKILNFLPSSVNSIAVWSDTQIKNSEILDYISEFSNDIWVIEVVNKYDDINPGFIYIARKILR